MNSHNDYIKNHITKTFNKIVNNYEYQLNTCTPTSSYVHVYLHVIITCIHMISEHVHLQVVMYMCIYM